MSRPVEFNNLPKPAKKFRRQFNALTLVNSLICVGFLLVAAYPQTVSVVGQQELPKSGKYSSAADSASLPNLSLLDIPSLIRDSDRLGTAMHSRLPEYTYLQTRLSCEFDQRGRLVRRVSVYEAYPIKVRGNHRHVISLISEDGSPISPKRLMKERQQAVREIEAAERDNALEIRGAPVAGVDKYVTAGIGVNQAGEGVWIGASQFLQHCRFDAPRYDRLADRDMIKLNMHSCAVNASATRERYLEGMAGIVWIDAADKVVARLEAWPVSETEHEIIFESPDEETLVYEQMRLEDGLWVPKRIRLNAIGRAALFNGTDKDMTFEFSRYQRFVIEVKDIQWTTLKSKQ